MIPLMRCVDCESDSLLAIETGIHCDACGRVYKTDRGVTDFFSRKIRSIPQKELEAIRKLDQGSTPESVSKLKEILSKMDQERIEPSPEELSEFSCLQHIVESKRQLEEVLQDYSISSRDGDPPLLLELGADHCWASNLFLDRGCRVIALDISDHLHLASRGNHENLCRINGDMNVLPLKDQSLDIVFSISAAHHSWDLQQTFREAARVLRKPGQLFFCCEPLPSWLRYPFGHDFGHEERLLGINECWVARLSWVRYCREAGFDRIELLYPNLSESEIRARLRGRRIPQAIAPLLRPFLKTFQVSIHLTAYKS